MTAAHPGYNPFQAPLASEPQELRLEEQEAFRTTPREILCREQVELPKICIFLGDTDDVAPRTKLLRTLSARTVLEIIGAAAAMFLLPLCISGLGFSIPAVVSILLFAGFGLIVWWSAKRGVQSVHATWYVCGRYRRRMRWHKRIAWLILLTVTGWVGLVVSRELESAWPFILLTGLGTVFAVSFKPEPQLLLAGKRNDAFVLRGHTKLFHEAVRRVMSEFHGATGPPDMLTPRTSGTPDFGAE